MRRLIFVLGALTLCVTAPAIELGGLRPIGSVTNFIKTENSVMLTCADQSEVRVIVLAPD